MKTSELHPNTRLKPLVFAWLGLVALTLLSIGLGEWQGQAAWLPTLVAAIIWMKAWLVAYFFLEAKHCHTFIRRLVWAFIAIAPIGLILIDHFGPQFAALVKV